jgi:signal transduction histidine kinase
MSERERIFESFHRLDGARSEGLGLGLAIVRRTAELLNCHVGVVSAPGRGSCFRVQIGSTGRQIALA